MSFSRKCVGRTRRFTYRTSKCLHCSCIGEGICVVCCFLICCWCISAMNWTVGHRILRIAAIYFIAFCSRQICGSVGSVMITLLQINYWVYNFGNRLAFSKAAEQANRLVLWVRWKLAATVHIHRRHCYYYWSVHLTRRRPCWRVQLWIYAMS